jgi:NAD(P)-dependent dehydrogenase (short-subunit alcohol dehydrogenase family)
MVDLSGRSAVVTGAGSGIGRAIALRLSQRGAKLALLGRTLEKLEAVAGEAQGEAICASVDVAVRSQVEEAFRAAARRLGPLHILVANAGIGGPNDLGEGDRWDEIVRTNLDGAYFCIRAFEGSMAQGADPRHILVISSCVARFGVPGISAYSAAKAGQLGLVRSLAAELAPKRVLVNAICPGWVDTRMAAERIREMAAEQGRPYQEVRSEVVGAVPLQRMSEPGEIAALVEFLLSEGGVAFTGQAFDPNNGAWMG